MEIQIIQPANIANINILQKENVRISYQIENFTEPPNQKKFKMRIYSKPKITQLNLIEIVFVHIVLLSSAISIRLMKNNVCMYIKISNLLF